MVSFQCHTCSDVVKKPKLDQHHARCHGGFDCIDCSTTFNTPAEYKKHTSCISEAEKYQKGLYKGPKQGKNGHAEIENQNETRSIPERKKSEPIETNDPSRQSNAQWSRIPKQTSLGNINGYPGSQAAGVQWRQPQPHWQNGKTNHDYDDRYRNGRREGGERRPLPRPSGANDTPLGTPRTTSPANVRPSIAPVVDVEPNPADTGHANDAGDSVSSEVKKKKQRKLKVDDVTTDSAKETKHQPEDLKIEQDSVDDVSHSAVEEKRVKKDKKKKRSEKELTNNLDEDHPEADLPVETEKHRKKRKEKEEKRKGKGLETVRQDVEMAPPEPKKGRKKRRQGGEANGETEGNDERAQIVEDVEMAQPVEKHEDRSNVLQETEMHKKRKEKEEERKGKDLASATGDVEVAPSESTKEKKKRRRDNDLNGEQKALVVEVVVETGTGVVDAKKEKKRRREKDGDDPTTKHHDDAPTTEKKESKKRKLQVGEESKKRKRKEKT